MTWKIKESSEVKNIFFALVLRSPSWGFLLFDLYWIIVISLGKNKIINHKKNELMTKKSESDIPTDINVLGAGLFNLPGNKFITFLEECKRQMVRQGLPDKFACASKHMENLVKCEPKRSGDAWGKKIKLSTPDYIKGKMGKFVMTLLETLSYKEFAELFGCLTKKFNEAGELYFREGIMIKAQQVEEVVHKLSLIRIEFAKLAQGHS